MDRRLHKFMAWDTSERRMLSSEEFLIVLEWSGLQDKHGKDIFEGHIVKKGHRVYPIIFKDGSFVIEVGSGFFIHLGHDLSDVEVIGDIFQNAELLEGSDEGAISVNLDDEINAVAQQAWNNSALDEAWEAYLRTHTFNGAMREFHDACMALGKAIVHELAATWLKILDTLGM